MRRPLVPSPVTPLLPAMLTGALLAGVTLLATAAAGAEAFSCAGPFARDASRAGLVKAFGADNVRDDEAFVRGDTRPMTIVFPADPERRLMVHWADAGGLRGLDFVLIQSPGWSAGGAAVGMPIAEVERLNGRPFKLTDFQGSGHDGEVRSWEGGRLDAALPGGCRVDAVLGINDGDVDTTRWSPRPDGLASDDEALRGADPRLYELTVSFPDAGGGR